MRAMHFIPSFRRGDIGEMRILLGIFSLILLSAFTGSGIAIQWGTYHRGASPVNTSLFLSVGGTAEAQSQTVINTHTDDRLQDLAQSEQASVDDRRLLHDQIYKLTETENQHFNSLHEQISIDEARLNGSTAIIGGGVTLLNAIALYMQLIDRRRRRKAEARIEEC